MSPTTGRATVFFLAAGLMLSMTGMAQAQDQRKYESVTESPRLFDSDRAENLRGTIAEIQSVVPSQGAAAFLQVELKTGRSMVTVHLAPEWYLEEQQDKIELDKGTEIEVRGSHATVNGKDVLVAAEILRVQNGDRLRLRHSDGTPVWAGSERAS
jgi:hypothetical protein